MMLLGQQVNYILSKSHVIALLFINFLVRREVICFLCMNLVVGFKFLDNYTEYKFPELNDQCKLTN